MLTDLLKFKNVNLGYFGMRFQKKLKLGVSFLCLFIFVTLGIIINQNESAMDLTEDNLIFLSAIDDSYEPNNDFFSAYDLSPFPASWLPFGLGNQSDDDWYRVYLDPGEQRLRVDLVFSHAAGDIDMEIYDNNYSCIMGSYSSDDNEYIDINLPMSGFYFIKVYGFNWGNLYDMWWEDLSSSGGDDFYEENDFDLQAYDLKSYRGWWLTGINGPGFQFDEDWYVIYVPSTDDRIKVEVIFDHFAGDIELELYDDIHNWVEGSYSSDNNEYLDISVKQDKIYYIRIFGSNMGNFYDLRYETYGEGRDGPYNPNKMMSASDVLIFLISYFSVVSLAGIVIMIFRR